MSLSLGIAGLYEVLRHLVPVLSMVPATRDSSCDEYVSRPHSNGESGFSLLSH